VNWRLSPIINIGGAARIPAADARRQARTAAEILRRFDKQPGVVLADEVGMGKTYVALATAVSVLEATERRRPVVVMVPPSVGEKWPRDWEVFTERCLRTDFGFRATDHTVRSGAEFLKLLDDPPSSRKDLIFLTHGALTGNLSDPYIKLALVRRALARPSLSAQRRAFPRWAGKLLPFWRFFYEDYATSLVESNPRQWSTVHRRHWGEPLSDDPVPEALLSALPSADLDPLIEALRLLPLRASSQLDSRLVGIRSELNAVLPGLWQSCLSQLNLDLPLLILDEAHHAKNPWTRLAQLFASPEAAEDLSAQGPFNAVFSRMLFLTATPFQLGHRELIEVLRRFTGVRWIPPDGRADYQRALRALESALDDAQRSALRLEASWSKLTPDDIDGDAAGTWWRDRSAELPDKLAATTEHFVHARQRLRTAERALRPWVIRHARPDKAARRSTFVGRAITTDDSEERRGLEIEGKSVLAFLLAARLQALIGAQAHLSNRRARAYFADGLASSFEAFRDTRRRTLGAVLDEGGVIEEQPTTKETEWYMRHIDRRLAPSNDLGAHSKISATADRAVRLWSEGEKVLIFCFFIATGRALRAHIAQGMRTHLLNLGVERLGVRATSPEHVAVRLQRFANSFFKAKSPVAIVARDLLTDLLAESLKDPADVERAVDVALRFVRTPSFLVRYVDVGAKDRADAFERALAASDASGQSLRDKIARFGHFLEDRVASERTELLTALEGISTGAELLGEDVRERERLPNVRLANGEVDRDLRRRLMLAFNTPFFPEVLVASSVMAEGVDLHLDCRNVIHHDLDWNPSVLEQRTGRVDRLGSKGEVTKRPIHVYEPFLEATQDEKQFRVVKDRERWFNVVMGEQLELDEWATDRVAARVPFPAEAAAELAFRLEVVRRR
jgi:hypothetical protein